MADLDFTKKAGPLPIWGWGAVAAGGAYLFIRHARAASAAAAGSAGSSGSSTGSGGQFSSTQTTTNPLTGDTSTYSASGPNSSIQSPAQLTYGAGPMGYSSGDVYVNLPPGSPPPAPVPGPPGPQGPPGRGDDDGHHRPPPPLPPRNPDWGHWETALNGYGVGQMAQSLLGDAGLGDKVWNDPVNKALHDLRGAPGSVQPGDVVWVFDGWRPGWKPPGDFVPFNPDQTHPTPAGPVVKAPPPDPAQNAGHA